MSRHHPKKIALLLRRDAQVRRAARARRAGRSPIRGSTIRRTPGRSRASSCAAPRRPARPRCIATEPGEWRLIAASGRPAADGAHAARTTGSSPRTRRLRGLGRGAQATADGVFLPRDAAETGLLMDGDAARGRQVELRPRQPQARGGRSVPGPAAARSRPTRRSRRCWTLVEARFRRPFRHAPPVLVRHRRGAGAGALCDHFVAHALPRFGDYQDAMLAGDRFLCHAVISALPQRGPPRPAARSAAAAEAEWRAGRAPLNAVEGFIRQIIGWREFVRGVYLREGAGLCAAQRAGPPPRRCRRSTGAGRDGHALRRDGGRRRRGTRPMPTTSSG